MTRRQWGVLAVIFVSVAVIAGGVVALVSSGGGDDSINADGSTSSSSSSTSAPSTAPPVTAPPVTVGPDTTPATIRPGSTIIVPTAPTVPPTKPPVTTTKPPVTTTTAPDGSSDVGITPTEIHLAVIADTTTGFDGMSAWAEQVNKHEIAGRKVVLDLLTSGGSAQGYAAAVQTACNKDFAIVGTFSAFDIDSDAAGCGIAIPDLPVEATGTAHAVAANTYAAFPRRPSTEAVGPYKWIAGNVPGCCAQYWLVPTAGVARGQTLATLDGAAKVGFTTAGMTDVSASDPASRYDDIVTELVDKHATFAASGLGADSTVLLRKAAGANAPGVKAWFCGSSCYDRAFLTAGGNDVAGELVAIETTPVRREEPRPEVVQESVRDPCRERAELPRSPFLRHRAPVRASRSSGRHRPREERADAGAPARGARHDSRLLW